MGAGTLGYGLAAIAFGVLTVLLGVAWRGRREGIRVILACGLTVVWAAMLASHAQWGVLTWPWAGAIEILRDGMWLFLLAGLASPLLRRTWLRAAYGIWGLCFLFAVASPLLAKFNALNWSPALVLSRAGLVISVINLLLLEQIYRNTTPIGRAALRSLVVGVGALMLYDLFLYSQAELLRGVAADLWNARGFLNAAAVPLLALAARTQPAWSMDLFISRQFVLYSATTAAICGYLAAMGFGGYWVRTHSGSWGGVAQILFLGAAVALLVALVSSQSLRRHAKVFISKHFYRNKYDYRLEWLRFIETLSASDEPDVRRVCVQAIAQIFSSPSGVLYVYHADVSRYVPVARWPHRFDSDFEFPEIDESIALVQLLRTRRWIVDLEEGGHSGDLRGTLELPVALSANKAARIIAPILQLDRLIGFVVLASPPDPFELTYEDRDLLRTVGRHIATHLAQQEADRALAEGRQFDAYNKLSAFMMHDLKNSVAQLQLIVTNARRHKHNPEFVEDVIDTAANTVDRITRLMEQLVGKGVTRIAKSVPLPEVVAAAVRRCENRKPMPVLSELSEATVVADADQLASAIEHVIRNAQDACDENGAITITSELRDTGVVLTVDDSGSGMSPEFIRERLFRPFDSTKGARGMGVGAYQVREYVRSIGGQVNIQSREGFGTQFSIMLPVASHSEASTADLSTSVLRWNRSTHGKI